MARGTYLPKTNKRILEVQTAQAVHFRRCEKKLSNNKVYS